MAKRKSLLADCEAASIGVWSSRRACLGTAHTPALSSADSRRDAAPSSALSSRQRRDVCADEGSAVRVDGEEQKQIPRTTLRAPENRGTSNNARDSAPFEYAQGKRDDNAVDGSVAANGGASPSPPLAASVSRWLSGAC